MGALGVAKGIGLGLTALSGVGAAVGLNSYGKDRRKDLVRQGPDEFGDYDLQLGDRLFVDTDSLEDTSNKVKMDKAKKDGRVRSAQRMDPSLQLLNGMSAEDFLDTYASDIRELKLNETIEADRKRSEAAYKSPQLKDERMVRERQYYDDRRDLQQSRLDLLNQEMRRDRREDRRFNEQMERLDRQDRRKAISGMTGGLAALAAAFAL